MTTKHTPGPWRVTGNEHYWQIDAEYDAVACNSFCYAAAGQPETSLANARLIAAAPSLLEALKDVTERYRSALIASGTDPEYADIGVGQFRAAIAKAEGSAD